jgi:hypothetical protein
MLYLVGLPCTPSPLGERLRTHLGEGLPLGYCVQGLHSFHCC